MATLAILMAICSWGLALSPTPVFYGALVASLVAMTAAHRAWHRPPRQLHKLGAVLGLGLALSSLAFVLLRIEALRYVLDHLRQLRG